MPQAIQLSGQAVQGFATAAQTISVSATTTATTSGTATVLMTAGPADFAGGVYDVALFAPSIVKGTTSITLELWLDGVFNQTIVAASVNAVATVPFSWAGRIAIVQGVHTLTVRGFVDAGTGTLTAGVGTTGLAGNAVLTVKPA